MEIEHQKIVVFDDFCQKCKHWKTEETENPCDECLESPLNWASNRPVLFEDNGDARN